MVGGTVGGSRVTEHVLLVGSSGGHLAQLLALRTWWTQHARSWVTFDTPDAVHALRDESDVTWAHHPTTRNLRNLARNSALAVSTLRRVRPTVIVSTGAALAWPFFLLARRSGTRTVYVEVYDRIDSPTLTARLCRPVTDLMLVQWDEQRLLFDDAVTLGRLL